MDEAKCARDVTRGQMHRIAGVKPDVRFTGDQRVIMKTIVRGGIVYDECPILQNGMAAE